MISVFAQPSATFVEGRLSVQSGEDSIVEVRAAGSRRGFMKLVNDTGMKRHTRHAFSFPVN